MEYISRALSGGAILVAGTLLILYWDSNWGVTKAIYEFVGLYDWLIGGGLRRMCLVLFTAVMVFLCSVSWEIDQLRDRTKKNN